MFTACVNCQNHVGEKGFPSLVYEANTVDDTTSRIMFVCGSYYVGAWVSTIAPRTLFAMHDTHRIHHNSCLIEYDIATSSIAAGPRSSNILFLYISCGGGHNKQWIKGTAPLFLSNRCKC